ncbi:MAG: SLBB domain-containing protein [Candidatus Levybacteria bacterium]|nr:SLBB domain-containing protein [Candidatus Levybacteria bacterium]
MEELSLPQKLLTHIKRNMLIVAVFSVGMICLLIGLIQYFSPKSDVIVFEAQGEVKAANTKAELDSLFVDVSGEVNSPGLYELKPKSRVKDALDKAGGVSSEADTEYISKNLNLAAIVTDGMKIYIPKIGQEASSQLITSSSGLETSSYKSVISINSGTQSDLELLAGVGPVTAQKIISNRPYASLEELVTKKAVSQALFTKIKEQLSL